MIKVEMLLTIFESALSNKMLLSLGSINVFAFIKYVQFVKSLCQ